VRLLSNDSTTRGYLTPVGDAPLYDLDLEQQVSQWILGITGLPAEVVFIQRLDPQGQVPQSGVTWCEFSISVVPRDNMPATVQVSETESQQWGWEDAQIHLFFYGPRGAGTVAMFRDGLWIEQNNRELYLNTGFALQDTGTITNIPILINDIWVRRYDFTVFLSRKIIRTYAIKSVLDSNVTITGD